MHSTNCVPPAVHPGDGDVVRLARAILERAPSNAERRLLAEAASGAGGLHSLRRLLMRAWVIAHASARETIEAADLAAASEGV